MVLAGSSPATQSPDHLAHWVVKTSRPEEMLAWYAVAFGARVVHDGGMVVFLAWDDQEHHRVAVVRMPRSLRVFSVFKRIGRKFTGIDHVALSYRSLQNLVGVYTRLRDYGVRPVWTINHGPTTSFYYDDPDGNRYELQCDNFKTIAECQAFMTGDDFRKNPIGVNVDPEYIVERLYQGVSAEVLLRPGEAMWPGQQPASGVHALSWRSL